MNALIEKAKECDRDGDLCKSMELWDQVLEQDPKHIEGKRCKQSLVTRFEVAQEAIRNARKASENKNLTESLARWETALRVWPHSDEAVQGLVEAEDAFKKFKELYAEAKELISEKKLNSALIALNQAEALALWPNASKYIEKTEERCKSAKSLVDLGIESDEKSLWRDALSKYEAALKINREAVKDDELIRIKEIVNRIDESVTQTRNLIEQGEFEKAIDTAQKGLDLEEHSELEAMVSKAEKGLQVVLDFPLEAEEVDKKDPVYALSLWKEVLTYKPDSADIKNKICQLQERLQLAAQKRSEAEQLANAGQWDKAWPLVREACLLNPQLSGTLDLGQSVLSNLKKQKLLIRIVVFLCVSFILSLFIWGVIQKQKLTAYKKHLTVAEQTFLKGEWPETIEALKNARLLVPTGTKKRSIDRRLNIAIKLDSVDRHLRAAKNLVQRIELEEAQNAYKRAHGKFKIIPLEEFEPEIANWIGMWEQAEFNLAEARVKKESILSKRVAVWNVFLQNFPKGKLSQQARLYRQKAISQSLQK